MLYRHKLITAHEPAGQRNYLPICSRQAAALHPAMSAHTQGKRMAVFWELHQPKDLPPLQAQAAGEKSHISCSLTARDILEAKLWAMRASLRP